MCSTTTAGLLPGPTGRKYSAWTVLFSGSGVTIGDGNRTAATVYRSVVRSGSISNAKSAASSRNRSGTAASAAVGRNATSPRSIAPDREQERPG